MTQMSMRKLAYIHDTQKLLNKQHSAVTSIWSWKLTWCIIYYIDFWQQKFCQSNKLQDSAFSSLTQISQEFNFVFDIYW